MIDQARERSANTAAHLHVYEDRSSLAERRMRLVTLFTVLMMLAEIGFGWWSHSMALLAEGWHMSSHALALGLAAAAYACSRRLATDERFAFGTWKIEVLGGYTSALLLAVVAAYMVCQSAARLLHPAVIAYNEALPVAVIGLLVNIACTLLLGAAAHAGHEHAHGAGAHPEHAPAGNPDTPEPAVPGSHPHQDLNLRSAYVHVAADCASSLLAIGALAAGKYLGLVWADAVVGLVGAVVVAMWALRLLRDSSRVLLDAEMDEPLTGAIRSALAASPIPARIQDLHVWRVSHSKFACLLSVASEPGVTAEHFRRILAGQRQLGHLTVEVNQLGAGE